MRNALSSGLAYIAILCTLCSSTLAPAAPAAPPGPVIEVTPNIPPSGVDKTVTIDEDSSYRFTEQDFGFRDPDGHAFAAVRIVALPTNGTLRLSGISLAAGQSISVAQIPNLSFEPDANEYGSPHASFTFQVQDDGGTAFLGVDTDSSPKTFTINVNGVIEPWQVVVAAAVLILVVAGIGATTQLWRPITVAQARSYAQWTLPQFVVTGDDDAAGVPKDYLDDWRIGHFRRDGPGPFEDSSDPLKVYDVHGRLLFYEFIFAIDDRRELRAQAAATAAIGVPVFSIGVNPPLALGELEAAARALAAQKGLEVAEEKFLVCYAFPALGLLCHDAERRAWIIDLAAQTIIPVNPAELPEGFHLDGHLPSSPLDPFSWRIANLLHRIRARYLFALEVHSLKSIAPSVERRSSPNRKVLRLRRLIGERSSLIAQEKTNWCWVAVTKMIVGFHDRSFSMSQTQIAGLLNKGNETVTAAELVKAIELASRKTLDAKEADYSPTFQELRDEINANRPLENAIWGHARVAIGWSLSHGGRTGQFIYLYDPSPRRLWQAYNPAIYVQQIHVVPKAQPPR